MPRAAWRLVALALAALAALPRLREISVEMAAGVTREGMAVFPGTVRVNYS